MSEREYVGGCDASPSDLRTFKYKPSEHTLAYPAPYEAGVTYDFPKQDQLKVGICTANDATQHARKALGMEFSADFQYLMQKKYYDKNWNEGSSILSSLKVGHSIGFLPVGLWTFTTNEDRKLPYTSYIRKLQAVSDADIERLKILAAPFRISAYAQITPLNRDTMAIAIAEGRAGVRSRYVIGSEWWRRPIEPLRAAKNPISGHAATDAKVKGDSFRVVNGWGDDWADKGTAYRLHSQYRPTEAWKVYYSSVPTHVQSDIEKLNSLRGTLLKLLQQLKNLTIKK
jgi:hypothetical protein